MSNFSSNNGESQSGPGRTANYRGKFELSRLVLFAVTAATLMLSTAHGQERRLYLANDDHTDFMWTADADTYERVFVEMLDFHLKLADETRDNAPPHRHRFNADGSCWLWAYERNKSPQEFARLVVRLKDGTISAPLNTLVSC